MLGIPQASALQPILTFDNWPALLFGRILDRKTNLVVYRKGNLDILVDHGGGDETGTRACIATDMYRKYLPLFTLPPLVRVLDLGANGGGFPLMLKLAGISLARAVCVEMNPRTFRRLQLNLSANLGDSALAINAAVCGMPEDSEIMLAPSRGSTGESMYANRADLAEPHVSVRTKTLQAILDRYFPDEDIDICKIDIEGAEYDLLESCPDAALQRIRYLIVEFHDSQRTPATVERFAALGFVDTTLDTRSRKEGIGTVRAFRGARA